MRPNLSYMYSCIRMVYMRCIFCKKDSSSSKSVEHIVPESLGNKHHILPPGFVCDACNNYFARKVEAPFLESEEIRSLRFMQAVPNKKGNIVSQSGIAIGKEGYSRVSIYKDALSHHSNDNSPEMIPLIDFKDKMISEGTIFFPRITDNELCRMDSQIVSRFLAKIAIECLASRFALCEPDGLDYMIDDHAFDALRNYARFGTGGKWPYRVRRIYDENRILNNNDGTYKQIVWESDFLFIPAEVKNKLPDQEAFYVYFIFALFGLEYILYIGSNDDDVFDLYFQWIKDNNCTSPLLINNN